LILFFNVVPSCNTKIIFIFQESSGIFGSRAFGQIPRPILSEILSEIEEDSENIIFDCSGDLDEFSEWAIQNSDAVLVFKDADGMKNYFQIDNRSGL
jgi:hypothetical protein